jgi:hypothetical protein
LELRFDFPASKIEEIARDLRNNERGTPLFEVGLYNADDQVVAWVYNRVAIRP